MLGQFLQLLTRLQIFVSDRCLNSYEFHLIVQFFLYPFWKIIIIIIYEAVALLLSAAILGSFVGIIIAVTMVI